MSFYRIGVCTLLTFLVVLTCVGTGNAQANTASLSLGERVSCQNAIEQVYWQHRTPGGESVAKPGLSEAVPNEVAQRKAEDAILQSAALEHFWGVRIGGEQLQAELNRMVAQSKAPDVLVELLAAIGNDPRMAAECLARPILTDRLIRSYYSSDERFHGELRKRAEAGLAGGSLRGAGGHYREVAWHRGPGGPAKAIVLQPADFEERVRDLNRSLGGSSGKAVVGRASALREDAHRFYSVAVTELDDSNLRLAFTEFPKVEFETWWATAREQFTTQLPDASYPYVLGPLAPNANCRDDSWKSTLELLDPRYWHTAVWTGTEMIVWGGMNSVGVYYRDGSRYNPATDTWTPVASLGAPSARQAHSAVWTGKEMIVFGGTGDNTGGKYDPVTDTWKPTSLVGAPGGPTDAAVVWTGKEMIVWGGSVFSPVNTGARYNPTTNKWRTLPPVGLAARAYMPAVWTGKEMIVWAGYDVTIGQVYNDGARYNPTTNTWTLINTAGAPSARYWHTAVWTGTEMIAWGGVQSVFDQSGGRYNPVTDSWTPTSSTNPPSLRWLHAAVWTGKEMIIQGGTPGNPVGGRYNPATDTWKATNPTNSANNGQGITAVWTGKEMIVWGGLDDNFAFHYDGGRYNPTTDSWLRTSTMNVPLARSFHSAVWTGSEMVVWGGVGDVILNDGGRYDPATNNWKTTSVVNAPLGGGDGQGAWTGSEAIFWVGNVKGGRYNPVTDSWKFMSTVNAPNERYGHTTVWTGKELIVFGGVGTDSVAKRYNPATDKWTNATTTNAPGPRDHHAAVWTGTEMIIWGGFINDGITPTGGRYNPTTNTWRATNIPASPTTRMWPLGVWTGTEMVVWGGKEWLFLNDLNDGGRYNPVTDSWAVTSMTGVPAPRIPQGVWTGKEMLLWGGTNDSTGGLYNPATDSWKNTTLANAPAVRYGGRWSTVWTGSQMIVWGGYVETQQGSLYCASGQANLAPVAVNDAYSVKSGKKTTFGNKVGVLANDTDPNADLLTARLVAKTQHGTLTFNSNGSFLYKSAKGFIGTDTFTYQADDSVDRSNSGVVTITVQ